MPDYLETNFPGLELQPPLFYSWPTAIRFEMGSPDRSAFFDQGKHSLVDPDYISEALARAVAIFEALFSSQDEIQIVCQQFSKGRKRIKKRNFLFQQIDHLKKCKITYSEFRPSYWEEDDDLPSCYRLNRVCMEPKLENVSYRNILHAQLNKDLGDNHPRMFGDCYFINRSKHIILYLYDDRGMDVVATNKETLWAVYQDFNQWILDYDRKRIDACFSGM